jgi:hypothetical protein
MGTDPQLIPTAVAEIIVPLVVVSQIDTSLLLPHPAPLMVGPPVRRLMPSPLAFLGIGRVYGREYCLTAHLIILILPHHAPLVVGPPVGHLPGVPASC